MILPKIYKRTSTGKIQEWEIEIEGNKFRTIVGQRYGKKVTSAWTTCNGKNIGRANATSAEEQALAEATARRRIKLEAEYREKIVDIDKLEFLTPMLAEEYDPDGEHTFPYFIQPKLDGIRCIASKAGLFTRKGKPILSCNHITNLLTPIFEAEDIEFDGELYNSKFKRNFDGLTSLIRRIKPTPEERAKAEKYLQYHVYDLRDPNSTFEERTSRLKELVATIDSPFIVFVETAKATDQKTLDAKYKQWLKAGFEGQMLRTDTVYEFKRTPALLKRKPMITDEFTIVDVLEGKGNRSGMAGKIVFELHEPTTEGETTCEANPKGTFGFFRKLLREKEAVIGKKATIEFQGYTPKKSIRFGRMLTIRDYE